MSGDGEPHRARKRGRWDSEEATPPAAAGKGSAAAAATPPGAANGAHAPGQAALKAQAAVAKLGDIRARLESLRVLILLSSFRSFAVRARCCLCTAPLSPTEWRVGA